MDKEEKAKRWAYKRMFVGAMLGCTSLVIIVYFWKVYPGPIHPIAGIGLLFVGLVGLVLGVILALFSRKWKSNDF